MLAQAGLGLPNLAQINGPLQQVEAPAVQPPYIDRSAQGDYGRRKTPRLVLRFGYGTRT